MAKNNKEVAVVGLWHLGSVYATSPAEMGFHVTGFDYSKKVVTNFQKGVAPIYEPGLKERLSRFRKNLTFSSKVSDLKNKEYIFIAHDLVVDENDRADTSVMDTIFKTVISVATENTIIVISSQVPLGTSRILMEMLLKKGILNPKVIYFPENLRLGTAYDSFLKPDRIILGSDNKDAMTLFQKDFAFTCPVVCMGLESAEMVKHALNTYLATCVSLSSEWTDIAELTGANMGDVIAALKSDRRVSQFAPINPGLGFAGATLGRDIQSLKTISAKYAYKPILIDSVYKVNQGRIPALLKKIQRVHPKLKGKTIGILGLTYKAGTNTLRRSMSLALANELLAKGVLVKAYDPAILKKTKELPALTLETNIKKFFKGLDMVVLMTDWKDFLEIVPSEVGLLMKEKIVVDTKNFLNKDSYLKEGFIYKGIGVE